MAYMIEYSDSTGEVRRIEKPFTDLFSAELYALTIPMKYSVRIYEADEVGQ